MDNPLVQGNLPEGLFMTGNGIVEINPYDHRTDFRGRTASREALRQGNKVLKGNKGVNAFARTHS
jgi:hypothetical protein